MVGPSNRLGSNHGRNRFADSGRLEVGVEMTDEKFEAYQKYLDETFSKEIGNEKAVSSDPDCDDCS